MLDLFKNHIVGFPTRRLILPDQSRFKQTTRTPSKSATVLYLHSTINFLSFFIHTHRYISHFMREPTMWFSNTSDTNQPVQSQKQARSLEFWILKEECYYPCSENYREADLRLCFRICRLLAFSRGGSYVLSLLLCTFSASLVCFQYLAAYSSNC